MYMRLYLDQSPRKATSIVDMHRDILTSLLRVADTKRGEVVELAIIDVEGRIYSSELKCIEAKFERKSFSVAGPPGDWSM